jgi:hypothetical protein
MCLDRQVVRSRVKDSIRNLIFTVSVIRAAIGFEDVAVKRGRDLRPVVYHRNVYRAVG